MPAVRPFRTALYLSLGLAVLALGVAAGDLLPEIPYLTGLSLVLLAAAYALEGRWQLSLRDANLMGLALGALLGLWGIYQVVRPPTGLADTLPWPASALPYLGPVLMILIPAKMFRPKHSGDYWAMHGLALLAVAMACAMAQDGAFVFLFALFAAAFTWSLTGFHLYREAGAAAADRPLAGGRWRALGPAVVWAGLTGAVAIPLFWATPRTGSQWELGLNSRGRVTGVSDGPVDLNTTGPVAVNRERAFEVYAEGPDGRPVLDLAPDQRWRVSYLQQYENGRWSGRAQAGGLQTADRSRPQVGPPVTDPRERLPDLGPGARHLHFTLDRRLTRTPPLADPVAWVPGDWSPAVSKFDDGKYRSWVHRHDGTVDGAFSFEGGPPQYVQAWAPPARPGDGPAMRVAIGPLATIHLTRPATGLGRLRAYTDRLVEGWVRDGTLPPGVLTETNPDTRARAPQYHEAIGRALERHLGGSGEFTYTLDLDRRDKGMDPTEDFVLNTKAGHCQRFATALVLMLRTQGVPSQIVIGYRGCEGRGDGWYDVREDHAHAWVEILVPTGADGLPPVWQITPALGGVHPLVLRYGQYGGALTLAATPLPEGWQTMRWVTLDPTPLGPAGEEDAAGGLLSQARQRWEAVFKALLLAYNRDSREQAAAAVGAWVRNDGGWAYLTGGAAILAGLWAWRRRMRRRRAEWAGIPDTLRRLALVLGQAGYPWSPGQTAREWARGAGAGLRGSNGLSGVAGVPEVVVAAYYADRFGGRPIGLDQRKALDADVRRLSAALA